MSSRSRQDLSSPSRLLWQCRRGMLEVELLLRGFVQHDYACLSDTMKCQFEDLLMLADPVLFDYLMGIKEPHEDGLRDVVQRIRKAACERSET